MPTCTLPYEVMFEFFNDTARSLTLQSTRNGEEEFASNATVELHPQESISLVLNAGSLYHYVVKQDHRKAQLSVKVWKDIRTSATDVFVRKQPPPSTYPPIASQGISIICPHVS